MPKSQCQISVLVDNDQVSQVFIGEIRSIDENASVTQVNFAGGLGEFVVIALHWTPLAIHIVMAFLEKKKPKKLHFESPNFEFTIENDGFSDPTVLKMLTLALEAGSKSDE